MAIKKMPEDNNKFNDLLFSAILIYYFRDLIIFAGTPATITLSGMFLAIFILLITVSGLS